MQTKPKPCKGIGKAKGYKGCGKLSEHRKYGLGIFCGCYSEWLLTTPEGKELMNKATLKATKPRRELEKEEKRIRQAKSLQNLLDSVKQVCHAYIRKRDEGKPCISCGAKWNKDFQAGHFYKAELYSSLRFDEYNINGQCRVCNLHKDGNFQGYGSGLKFKIGAKMFYEVNQKSVKEKQTDFKWDREELKRIRTYYRNKLKENE